MGSFRSAAERFYRGLVRFYPKDFRAEYADEMTRLFRDRSREEPLLPLLFAVAVDALKTAPKEHLAMLSQDLRYATRTLVRNPAFTLIAAGSLAIGIGANAAVFSLADALLLRPLPIPRPYEVVSIRNSQGGNFGGAYSSTSYLDYVDLRERSRSLAGLVAFDQITATLGVDADALPRLTLAMLVSGNFFEVIGVEPEIGRSFGPEEDQAPGRNPVAVLSHATWKTAYRADPGVLGKTVRLNGVPLTIVGVAPARFTGMDQYTRPALFVPLAMGPALLGPDGERMLTERDARGLTVKGRLRRGVSLAQADAEMAPVRNPPRLRQDERPVPGRASSDLQTCGPETPKRRRFGAGIPLAQSAGRLVPLSEGGSVMKLTGRNRLNIAAAMLILPTPPGAAAVATRPAPVPAPYDYYDRGGDPHPNLDSKMQKLGLTAGEKADLLAFLQALSGRVVQLQMSNGGRELQVAQAGIPR
jgi:hypothetical protein